MEIASNVTGGNLDDVKGPGKFGGDGGNAGTMAGFGGLTEEGTYDEQLGMLQHSLFLLLPDDFFYKITLLLFFVG